MPGSPRTLAAALLAALAVPAAPAPPGACGSPLPAELAPPAAATVAFELLADGVQIYACEAGPTGPAWTFKAPEATLAEVDGRPAGRHGAGPTWTATDGSAVQGTKIAGATPDASAIPWLLLRAASHQGAGRMERVAWVQRVRTHGGLAPATGCDASHLGAVARVPYTASYCFLGEKP